MKHRLLTGLAVAPFPLAVLTPGPAEAASGLRVATPSAAQGWRMSPSDAGQPSRQAVDSFEMLAGNMVAAAGAAFAGTAMVRRRKG